MEKDIFLFIYGMDEKGINYMFNKKWLAFKFILLKSDKDRENKPVCLYRFTGY